MLLPLGNTHVQFPYQLDTGKNCHTWISLQILADELRRAGFHGPSKLKGMYDDQVGNTYMSKPYTFDPTGWASRTSDSK